MAYFGFQLIAVMQSKRMEIILHPLVTRESILVQTIRKFTKRFALYKMPLSVQALERFTYQFAIKLIPVSQTRIPIAEKREN